MACLLLEYEDIRSYPRGGVRVSPARGTECVAYGYPAHAGGVAVAHHVGRMLRCAEGVRAECRRGATPRLATAGAARGLGGLARAPLPRRPQRDHGTGRAGGPAAAPRAPPGTPLPARR